MGRTIRAAALLLAALSGLTPSGCGSAKDPPSDKAVRETSKPDASKPGTISTETAHAGEPQGASDSNSEERKIDLGNGVQLELVRIPPGEFTMGSPNTDKDARDDEKPQHVVRITQPYFLGKYLVTQQQWQAVMGGNPSHFKSPQNPVEEISWDDCQQFLGKLNAKLPPGGGAFQLPTEAQWEYACRAGSKTRYCFGDDEGSLDDFAWHLTNAGNRPHPVGQKRPNARGLYDMHGNVGEWCQDWYDGQYYAASPRDNPPGPAAGTTRVNRGGGWDRPARFCRSALRSYYAPGFRLDFVGLRVCLVVAD